jgi:hypothetical protein
LQRQLVAVAHAPVQRQDVLHGETLGIRLAREVSNEDAF